MTFSFGNTASSSQPAFGAQPAAPASGFSFSSTPAASTGFGGFGATTASTSTPSSSFGSFAPSASANTTAVPSFGGFGTSSTPATTQSTAIPSFAGFGAPTTAPTASTSSFGSFGAPSTNFGMGSFGAGSSFAQPAANQASKPQGPTMKAIEELQRSYAPMRDASGRYVNKVENGVRNDECSFKTVMLNKRNGAKSQAEQLIYGEQLEQVSMVVSSIHK